MTNLTPEQRAAQCVIDIWADSNGRTNATKIIKAAIAAAERDGFELGRDEAVRTLQVRIEQHENKWKRVGSRNAADMLDVIREAEACAEVCAALRPEPEQTDAHA